MGEDIKDKVLEFAAIAKECPDNLQEKCFELLLSSHLSGVQPPKPNRQRAHEQARTDELPEQDEDDGGGSSQEDIQAKDIHLKARKFLQKHSLTVDDLNQVFYKEAESFLPLYEDLKTTRAAESQIRIALLCALEAALRTGDFEFNGESVREECQARKCYDGNNFSANFKNNGSLFDKFDKYNKRTPAIRLSENGRKELAELIKELR